MTTYKDSGVDVQAGDEASRLAYKHASSTFASRKGMIGTALMEEDGYAGFIDMGDHYLVQSDDSTGSKIDIAFQAGTLGTLGYDLVAMVADDAVCTGAEVIGLTNTLDIPKVDPKIIDVLMGGLAKACREQKILIPGGEIAEVPGAVTHGVWSATIVGIVEKEKVIRTNTIAPGDVILSLASPGGRSNGFSLIRKILTDKFGSEWTKKEWKNGTTWGEAVLTPSVIYHDAVLSLIGRYKQKREINVKGIAHITGGGIPSKLRRVLKKSGYGAELNSLHAPDPMLTDIIALGSVPLEDAYRTWNMGNGMLLIITKEDAERSISLLGKKGITAQIAGVVSENPAIVITSKRSTLTFS